MWMTPAEAWFLRAEYELRWGSESDAATYYAEGIRTSFSTLGASGAEDYIADKELTPGSYTDMVTGGNSNHSPLASLPICWKAGGNFETHLEQIITQKYLAMFPEGQEAWSEFRRTGYPRLFPVRYNYPSSGVDTNKQIRRMVFPQSEYSNNGAAVQEAVKLLGGPDNGGTKRRWDKKN